MERISRTKSQMGSQTKNFSEPCVKNPNDVVIVACLRTPLTKARRGGLNNTKPEDMLAHVFRSLIKRTNIDPKLIEDICVGNVLMPGSGALIARAAQMMANLPIEVPVSSCNRLCSSGLEAVAIVASKIRSGIIDCGIGCGVESMSLYDMNSLVDPNKLSEDLFENDEAANCLIPMGMTSEILAEKYGLVREKLDRFAMESQRRASYARKNGLFKNEIEPIQVMHLNTKTKKLEKKLLEHDDGIRDSTTYEKLSKLNPAFKRNGLSTGGNSSQTSDGAGGVLLMKRSLAEKLNLKVLGKIINHAVVGVPPEIMGVGPAYAIPKVLKNSGLSKDDIGVYEINEAFASQCTYCLDYLGLDPKKVNPKGGAIALGHPLGATGARQISTLIYELHRIKKRFGVISMCIGTGMGAAAVFEAEF